MKRAGEGEEEEEERGGGGGGGRGGGGRGGRGGSGAGCSRQKIWPVKRPCVGSKLDLFEPRKKAVRLELSEGGESGMIWGWSWWQGSDWKFSKSEQGFWILF